MTQRVDAQGGKGGSFWDHGINSGVKKIYVGRDDTCISYLKVEYFSDGTVKSHAHGIQVHKLQEFVVDYPNEYITSVEGTYASAYGTAVVVTSLVFKTSTGRVSPRFGNPGFVLKNNGRRLVGFHGKSGFALDAIGAHFAPDSSSSNWAPPRKLAAQGGPGGGMWDDGVHSGVRKVYIGRDDSCVTKVKFDYVSADSELETREHGRIYQHPQEFLLDYPNEYITSVEGTTGKTPNFKHVVTSLAFTTSTGRTSPTFGATKFVLEDNGRQVVGFHGKSGFVIDSIGAHFALRARPPS
ncbi:unnamed protein product [Microthlaspi erraticum]|uniref:Jacalin-type lectin domain-containing protein n=1 Tax=Microthlaspi erraticum TaxID=1685480 RepID=A0A6D2JZM3_9BRAS|nr:unnamed protein product [Microthlaspi erraticum]